MDVNHRLVAASARFTLLVFSIVFAVSGVLLLTLLSAQIDVSEQLHRVIEAVMVESVILVIFSGIVLASVAGRSLAGKETGRENGTTQLEGRVLRRMFAFWVRTSIAFIAVTALLLITSNLLINPLTTESPQPTWASIGTIFYNVLVISASFAIVSTAFAVVFGVQIRRHTGEDARS